MSFIQSWAHTDISNRVNGSRVPTLVLAGEHDAALPSALIEETWGKWHPNVCIDVVENSGHYPMFETPVALVTAVETFLARAK